jgi:ribosomal subunit interface protein
MNIAIHSKDFTVKEELTGFIKEKAEKLFRIYDNIISCEVVLKIDKSATKESKACDMRLIIPGNDLLAGAKSKTFEEAAMQAIGALEKQIEKRKNKTT